MLRETADRFLSERLGAMAKCAWTVSERGIRFVQFAKAAEAFGMRLKKPPNSGVGKISFDPEITLLEEFGAAINTSGRHMSPWKVGNSANAANCLRQKCVDLEKLHPIGFIIRVSRIEITPCVNDEDRLNHPDIIEQVLEASVIKRIARERNKRPAATAQCAREALTYITGCT